MAGLLQGRVAVVTGAAKGFGEAICRAYSAEGAIVVASDIDGAGAERVAKGLRDGSSMACDVSRPEQVEALVDTTTKRHGRLDVMVANAGIGNLAPLAQMSYEQWRGVTSVNLDGVFLCIRYAAPVMIANGGGVILTMCSITSQAGTPLIGHYAAAKAGVMSLTQTAAVELRSHGIRVNAILPGFADTDLVRDVKQGFMEALGIPDFDAVVTTKQTRYGTPQDVAKLAVFLASDRARFSNGSGYVIDGGARASLL